MSLFGVISGFIAANGGPIAVGVIVAQAVARAIPDNQKGVLGVIRTAAKIAGGYVNTDEQRLEKYAENATARFEQLEDDTQRAINLARRAEGAKPAPVAQAKG